jgi:hypothetical protein
MPTFCSQPEPSRDPSARMRAAWPRNSATCYLQRCAAIAAPSANLQKNVAAVRTDTLALELTGLFGGEENIGRYDVVDLGDAAFGNC